MPKTPDETPYPDLIMLLRMVRDDEAKWQAARSWFGGLPVIEKDRWPRSAAGVPLHHLAHIDLSEVPRGALTPSLPDAGTLSFFADTELEARDVSVAVLYSEASAATSAVEPPGDCPPLHGSGWHYHLKDAPSAIEAPRVFRRWPMDFMLMKSLGRRYDQDPAIDVRLGPKPESLHVFDHTRIAYMSTSIFPWDAIRRIVDAYIRTYDQHLQLRRPSYAERTWSTLTSPEKLRLSFASFARTGYFEPLAGTREKIAKIRKERTRIKNAWRQKDSNSHAVRSFIEFWSAEVARHDPFSSIGAQVAERLEEEIRALGKLDFRCGLGGGTSPLKDAASNVYRDMLVGPREIFERIPAEIRDYLLYDRRRSAWDHVGPHQMFGVTARYADEPDYLSRDCGLFSARCDDMLSWLWGDVGELDIWMSLEDLAARRWDRARGTFWGH